MKNILKFIFLVILLTSCSDNSELGKYRTSQENFQNSISSFQTAGGVISNTVNGNLDLVDSLDKILFSWNESIRFSKGVGDDYLNFLNEDLCPVYKTKFVAPLETLSKELERGNFSNVEKLFEDNGAAINEFSVFMETNRIEIESNFERVAKSEDSNFLLENYWLYHVLPKNFFGFFLNLILSIFVFVLVFVLSILLGIGISMGVGKFADNLPSFIANVFYVVATFLMTLPMIYLFGLWGAYCSEIVRQYISNPEVKHAWLYWLIGFAFANFAFSQGKKHAVSDSEKFGQDYRWQEVLIIGALAIMPILGFFFYSKGWKIFEVVGYEKILVWLFSF